MKRNWGKNKLKATFILTTYFLNLDSCNFILQLHLLL